MLKQIKLTNTIIGRSISNEKSVKGQQKKKDKNRQTEKETQQQTNRKRNTRTDKQTKKHIYKQKKKHNNRQTAESSSFWSGCFLGLNFQRKKILGFIEVDRVNERCLETFK